MFVDVIQNHWPDLKMEQTLSAIIVEETSMEILYFFKPYLANLIMKGTLRLGTFCCFVGNAGSKVA